MFNSDDFDARQAILDLITQSSPDTASFAVSGTSGVRGDGSEITGLFDEFEQASEFAPIADEDRFTAEKLYRSARAKGASSDDAMMATLQALSAEGDKERVRKLNDLKIADYESDLRTKNRNAVMNANTVQEPTPGSKLTKEQQILSEMLGLKKLQDQKAQLEAAEELEFGTREGLQKFGTESLGIDIDELMQVSAPTLKERYDAGGNASSFDKLLTLLSAANPMAMGGVAARAVDRDLNTLGKEAKGELEDRARVLSGKSEKLTGSRANALRAFQELVKAGDFDEDDPRLRFLLQALGAFSK